MLNDATQVAGVKTLTVSAAVVSVDVIGSVQWPNLLHLCIILDRPDVDGLSTALARSPLDLKNLDVLEIVVPRGALSIQSSVFAIIELAVDGMAALKEIRLRGFDPSPDILTAASAVADVMTTESLRQKLDGEWFSSPPFEWD